MSWHRDRHPGHGAHRVYGAHREPGQGTGPETAARSEPRRSRLYRRPRRRAKIMGVCGGIADYLGWNASLVRVLWLISLVMFTVPTLIGYFALAWLLDTEPEGLFETQDEEAFWRRVRTEPSQTLSGLKHKFRALELRLRDMEAYVTSPAFKLDRELR